MSQATYSERSGCRDLHPTTPHPALLQVRSPEDTEETLVDMQTAKGVTPLAMAAEKGRLDVVRDLLQRKADPNHKDAGETTALHLAAQVGGRLPTRCPYAYKCSESKESAGRQDATANAHVRAMSCPVWDRCICCVLCCLFLWQSGQLSW